MSFFFDQNTSPRLVQGLRCFGENVTHITEIMPEDTTDEEWLEYVGKKGMFGITRDDKILRNPREIEAFRRHRVGAFFLAGKHLSSWQEILQVVVNWQQIKGLAEKSPPPFAFRVRSRGKKIERIF
jgi:hypothetical protein